MPVDGGRVLTQSLPIIEFLDETRPLPLLPVMAFEHERVPALAQRVASDIRPLITARVLEYIAVDALGCGSGKQIFNKEGAVRNRFCASFGKYQMNNQITNL